MRRACRCRWSHVGTGSRRTRCFTCRRLLAGGALSAIGAGGEVVAASEYRVLQEQVRELQRPLAKKTLENEIVRDERDLAQPKTAVARALAGAGRHAMKTIADTVGVARSNLAASGPLSQITAVGGRRGKRLSCTSHRALHAVQMPRSLEFVWAIAAARYCAIAIA